MFKVLMFCAYFEYSPFKHAWSSRRWRSAAPRPAQTGSRHHASGLRHTDHMGSARLAKGMVGATLRGDAGAQWRDRQARGRCLRTGQARAMLKIKHCAASAWWPLSWRKSSKDSGGFAVAGKHDGGVAPRGHHVCVQHSRSPPSWRASSGAASGKRARAAPWRAWAQGGGNAYAGQVKVAGVRARICLGTAAHRAVSAEVKYRPPARRCAFGAPPRAVLRWSETKQRGRLPLRSASDYGRPTSSHACSRPRRAEPARPS